MKKLQKSLMIGLIAVGTYAVAGSVTIPNSFTANTTAKAAEVNDNFTAVKDAINGNAADVATNKTGVATNKTAIATNKTDVATNKTDIATNKTDVSTNKADIATNTTNIATKVTNVTASGGIKATRTGANVALKLKSGYVAVHGSAFGTFSEYSDACDLIRSWRVANMGLYFSSASTTNSCSAFASIQIPYGARVKKLTCRVKHNHADDLSVRLVKQTRSYSLLGGSGNIVRSTLVEATLDAGDTSGDTQEISGIYTPPPVVVRNPNYNSYFIEWDPPATSSASNNEMLYDCKVDYEYR